MWRACALKLSCVRLFVTPWTVAHQAPLSMELPRQEYWSGLPFLTPLYVISKVFSCVLQENQGELCILHLVWNWNADGFWNHHMRELPCCFQLSVGIKCEANQEATVLDKIRWDTPNSFPLPDTGYPGSKHGSYTPQKTEDVIINPWGEGFSAVNLSVLPGPSSLTPTKLLFLKARGWPLSLYVLSLGLCHASTSLFTHLCARDLRRGSEVLVTEATLYISKTPGPAQVYHLPGGCPGVWMGVKGAVLLETGLWRLVVRKDVCEVIWLPKYNLWDLTKPPNSEDLWEIFNMIKTVKAFIFHPGLKSKGL